jgi:hypothetical protein
VGDSRSSSHADGNGVNISILSEIAREIVRHEADFVLFPGDLVNGGVDRGTLEVQLLTWRSVMQPAYGAGIDVYPVHGNHELGNPAGTTAWNNVFSGDYQLPANGPIGELNLTYSVEHKNILTQHHHRKQYGYVLVDVKDSGMELTWYERNNETGGYEPPVTTADFDGSGIVGYLHIQLR